MKAKNNITTPASLCMYAHLIEPDVFKKDGQADGKPNWCINTVVEDTPEWDTFLSEMVKFENNVRGIEGLPDTTVSSLIRTNKEGQRTVRFHTYNNQYLRVVGADTKPFSDNPGNGSLVRVNGKPDFVRGDGDKINARIWLASVQVINYVEYTGDNPFDVVEGDTTADPNSEAPFSNESTTSIGNLT